MALQISSDADYVYQDRAGFSDPYTIMAWVLVDTVARTNVFFSHSNAVSGGSIYSVVYQNDGDDSLFIIVDNTDLSGAGSVLVADTWYHLAATRSGTSHELFFNGVSDTTVTATSNPSRRAAYLGSSSDATDGGAVGMRGRMAAAKLWDVVLTANEISQEMEFFMPIRTSGLLTWSPFVADETVNFRDYSGSANDWTEQGVVTAGAGPPITWRKGASKIFVPAGAAPPATGRAKFLPLLGVA